MSSGNFQDPQQGEIGRRLSVNELKERTVVCVTREDRQTFFTTLWVEKVELTFVVFMAARASPVLHFAFTRRPDDTLVDDEGKLIFVHEYLGEV